jgi:hypothetical protein
MKLWRIKLYLGGIVVGLLCLGCGSSTGPGPEGMLGGSEAGLDGLFDFRTDPHAGPVSRAVEVPTLKSPPDGSLLTEPTNLEWNKVSGAKEYQILLTLPSGRTGVAIVQKETVLVLTGVWELLSDGPYTWQVRAGSKKGWGDYSEAWTFSKGNTVGEVGAISGRVTERSTGDPISGATVEVRETHTGLTRQAEVALSRQGDEEGTYLIENVPAGTYEVTAWKSGYEQDEGSTQSGVVVIARQETQDVTLTLTLTGSLRLWFVETDEFFEYDGLTGEFTGNRFPLTGIVAATHMEIHPTRGTVLIGGGDSDNVVEYDAKTGAFVREFIPPGSGGLDSASGLAFHPVTGNLLVSGFWSHKIHEYHGDTGAPIGDGVFAEGSGLYRPLCPKFHPTTGHLLVGQQGKILEFDGDGNYVGIFAEAFVNDWLHFAFSPDGSHLILLFQYTHKVWEYDPETGEPIGPIAEGGSGQDLDFPTEATFHPVTGNLLVSAGNSGKVLEYKTPTWEYLGVFTNPPQEHGGDLIFLSG